VLLPVYLLRLDPVCGLYSDDAWYVLLGKAIASGRGYTVINAPTPGGIPMYPPGFPLALAVVFALAPTFPRNVALLKAVSILAMAGVAVLTLVHCRRDRRMPLGLAWTIALATALHPAFVFLATSTVMSECFFTLVQLAGVVLIERVARREGPAVGLAVGAGGLASFAFLTRSIGIALVVAGGLRLLLGRRWAATIAFVVGVALTAAPWLLYAHPRAPTPAQQVQENDGVMYGYDTHFWLNVAGHREYGVTTVRDLPMRMWGQLSATTRSTIGALHVYFPFRSVEPAAWGKVSSPARVTSLVATALVAIGFLLTVATEVTTAELLVPLSLLITLLWPFPPTRFVLPLLPFLLGYTARTLGFRTLAMLFIGGLAVISIATDAHDLGAVRGPAATRPRWNRIFDEEMDLMRWLRAHVPADQIVATIEPAFVHLYTGLTTVGAWDDGGGPWRAVGARVLADTSYSEPEPSLARFPVLYQTPGMGPAARDLSLLHGDASSGGPR